MSGLTRVGAYTATRRNARREEKSCEAKKNGALGRTRACRALARQAKLSHGRWVLEGGGVAGRGAGVGAPLSGGALEEARILAHSITARRRTRVVPEGTISAQALHWLTGRRAKEVVLGERT